MGTVPSLGVMKTSWVPGRDSSPRVAAGLAPVPVASDDDADDFFDEKNDDILTSRSIYL